MSATRESLEQEMLKSTFISIFEKRLEEMKICISKLNKTNTYKKCYNKRLNKVKELINEDLLNYEKLKNGIKYQDKSINSDLSPILQETINELNKIYESINPK